MDDFNKTTVDYRFYVIVDEARIADRNMKDLVEAVLRGGATLIQYRCKQGNSRLFFEHACIIHDICAAHGIPLIINDRVDIALAVNAEGVHVGQHDLPVSEVRRLTGPAKIIGLSITRPEDLETIEEVDYLGVGAVFATHSKPDAVPAGLTLLSLARQRSSLPVVAIGGIQHDNIRDVFQAGADGAAVISAILGSADPERAVQELRLNSGQ